MTGELTITNHSVNLKRTNADISKSTLSNNTYAPFGAQDANGLYFGYTQAIQYNDGSTAMQISARNKKTGESNTFDHSLVLRSYKDGSKKVTIDLSAWIKALGLDTVTTLWSGSITGGSTYTLNSSYKFSNYLLLVFQTSGYGNFQALTVPSSVFRMNTSYIWHLAGALDSDHSYNTSFKYKSDTQFVVNGKANSVNSCSVYGLIKLN